MAINERDYFLDFYGETSGASMKHGLSQEQVEMLKEYDDWLGSQTEVISTPVDEERLSELQMQIQTLTPEEWLRPFDI